MPAKEKGKGLQSKTIVDSFQNTPKTFFLRMNRTLVTLLLFLLVSLSAMAQKKTKKTIKAQKSPIEQKDNALEMKRKQMVAATQKILFIDSVVVDKQHFLAAYRLSSESGEILTYSDFFKENEQPNAYAYVNELGDKCYFSEEDSVGNMRLYSVDKLGKEWTKPMLLKGLDDENLNVLNYPFVLNDGLTLYFAAKGKESLGGYDIFVTRFDSGSGSFLKPENMGMPFNSEANDYMMIIDEQDSIGWFASDRNQTEGKVCIYMFVPAETRQTYADDGLTQEQLESRAKISRIADSWGDGKARQKALARLKNIASAQKEATSNGDFKFVVNDKTVYSRLSDFRTQEGRNMMQKLQTLKAQYANLSKALTNARNFYSTANAADRKALTSEILQSEQQLESLGNEINSLEKGIRNKENK